jgi:hypothetical protein
MKQYVYVQTETNVISIRNGKEAVGCINTDSKYFVSFIQDTEAKHAPYNPHAMQPQNPVYKKWMGYETFTKVSEQDLTDVIDIMLTYEDLVTL